MSAYVTDKSAIGLLLEEAAATFSHTLRRFARLAMTTLFAVPALVGSAAIANAEDRALKLYFTHTGEKATITYKRDGRFDPKGLAQINRFLRDWRRNEPARMDPRLLDLVWEVYDRSNANGFIHIVSAYRSPATNNMLRSRSRSTGVAKKSQHMLGKAMDFYIPGVQLSKLRALAMQMQVGGVGYYPTSGSPFVHLDVGNVRAWPRMSRKELARTFPNGRTMHLAADGSSLPGHAQAVADYKKRIGRNSIEIASTAGESDEPTAREDNVPTNLLTALYPKPRSLALDALALQTKVGGQTEKQSFVDLSSYAIPIPSMRPLVDGEADLVDDIKTASLGPITTLTKSASSHVGFEPSEIAQVNLQTRMETISSLPLTLAKYRGANFGDISGKALLMWALHSPGDVMGLRAPSVSNRLLQATAAGIIGSGSIAPVAEVESFDLERFAG